MSDDITTPKPQHLWDLLRGQVEQHHDRINNMRSQQIRESEHIAQLRKDVDELETTMKDQGRRLHGVEIAVAKGYVISGVIAAVGAAVVSWVLGRL